MTSLLIELEMNKANKSHILQWFFLHEIKVYGINKYIKFPMSLYESTKNVICASTTVMLFVLPLVIQEITYQVFLWFSLHKRNLYERRCFEGKFFWIISYQSAVKTNLLYFHYCPKIQNTVGVIELMQSNSMKSKLSLILNIKKKISS